MLVNVGGVDVDVCWWVFFFFFKDYPWVFHASSMAFPSPEALWRGSVGLDRGR